eukprot:6180492-Pleurochrysis_carterae.AAC.1
MSLRIRSSTCFVRSCTASGSLYVAAVGKFQRLAMCFAVRHVAAAAAAPVTVDLDLQGVPYLNDIVRVTNLYLTERRLYFQCVTQKSPFQRCGRSGDE